MESSIPTPRFVPPGATRALQVYNVLSETIFCKLSGEDTNGAYAVLESITPPDGGPPLHVHTREDECFYILEGEYEFQVGEQTLRASAGSFLFGPRGTPHRFRNVGSAVARHLVIAQPAGIENFFSEISDLTAEAEGGPPDLTRVHELAARYGIELLGAPARQRAAEA